MYRCWKKDEDKYNDNKAIKYYKIGFQKHDEGGFNDSWVLGITEDKKLVIIRHNVIEEEIKCPDKIYKWYKSHIDWDMKLINEYGEKAYLFF